MNFQPQATLSNDFILITKQQFLDKFQMQQKCIGSGSFGDVYKGQTKQGIKVAIKQFNNKALKNKTSIINQIQMSQSLEHPNLISFIGCYKVPKSLTNFSDHNYYMITQFAENGNLQNQRKNLQILEFQQKVLWCLQIVRGIHFLHQKNLMHRDIKPQNILVDKYNHMKICDFGCIKASDLLQSHSLTGTPAYMDPKVQTGKYSKKCDIFSLGLVMYFVFSGKGMFDNVNTFEKLNIGRKKMFRNIDQILKYVSASPEIKILIKKCLKQNEFTRIQIKQLLKSLQEIYKEIQPNQEKNISSTLISSQQPQKFDQMDNFILNLIDLNPELDVKNSVQNVKKDLLLILSKLKNKGQKISDITSISLQKYKKQILVFLGLFYYIRIFVVFKKWCNNGRVNQLPDVFKTIDIQEVKDLIIIQQIFQKQNKISDSYRQFLSQGKNNQNQKRYQKTFNSNIFDEQTLQMFKKLANQQISKYNSFFLQLSKIISDKIKIIEKQISKQIKMMVKCINDENLQKIQMFKEDDIKRQYSQFFIDKCTRQKEALNIKNSQIRKKYTFFRDYLRQFENFEQI